ncbi:ABC transporter ATP-binding protein [Thalassospira sp. MA62]|nr:ABC transporter ATP-binding protein [Thalassospira sp. MA62]
MNGKIQAASVTFETVRKAYDDVIAVRDIDFTVGAGELVTLLGPSGCGKTTTLRLIAGLEMPTSGRILIGDQDVSRLAATERDVAMVFQSYALFPHMSVVENVAYGLRMSGRNARDAAELASGALAQIGLQGMEKRLPSELSGGQQQRVAVARALVVEPKVLLFDEPLSNLDAKLRRKVREDIRELQLSLGLTVIYVTHDQQEALAVSDRVIVMNDAVIAQQGAPRELYENPVSRFVAEFVGDTNILQFATMPGDDGKSIWFGDAPITLPGVERVNGQATIALRPEVLDLHREKPSAGGLAGTVRKATYIGTHMEYTLDTDAGEVFAVNRDVVNPHAVGDTVFIAAPDHGITVIGE